jgi:hypothetical protein
MTALTAGSVSDKICRYASSIMAQACRGRLSQPETTRHKQVSLIITKSHQGSGRKPNMAYLLLTATQKKFLQDSGQE